MRKEMREKGERGESVGTKQKKKKRKKEKMKIIKIKIKLTLEGHIVDKHCLYDANLPTKIETRCCAFLCFMRQSISGWHFT
jgi:hypothetical protein